MEPIDNTNQDIHPDVVTPQTLEELVQSQQGGGIQSYGGRTTPTSGAFTSPKFKAGEVGWALYSNGDMEANNGTFRGTFEIGGTVKTINAIADLQTSLDEVSAAGGGTVYLNVGTYVLTADITIPAGVRLEGVSRDECILSCGIYTVKMTGSDAYSTGTVTINNGDTTVVGSGTTWTSAMVGREILLNGFYYEITARTDNTHITIAGGYAGPNLSGASYVLATVNHNSSLRTVTVTGASGAGVTCIYCFEPNIDDVIVNSCTTGIDMDYTVYPLFFTTCEENGVNANLNYVFGFEARFSAFDYSTSGAGFLCTNCGGSTFFDSSATGNTGNGVSLTSCSNIAFISTTWGSNGGHGVELISGNTDIQFVAANPVGNTGDGYKLTATSDRISISTCSITDNGGYGVNIAASTCDNNTIVAPSFSNNTSGNINDSGTDTVIIQESDTPTANFTSYREIAGATTPAPVYVNANGTIQISEADVSEKAHFIGFVGSTNTGIFPTFVNGSSARDEAAPVDNSWSVTCNAGTDRVLIVHIVADSFPGGSFVAPSSVTWGATTLTLLDNDAFGTRHNQLVYYKAIGTSGSNQTNTLTLNGVTINDGVAITWGTFDKVDQTTPIATSLQATGSGTTPTSTITPSRASSLILSLVGSAGGNFGSWGDGQTSYASQNGSNIDMASGYVAWHTLAANAFDASITSAAWAIMNIELKAASSSTVAVRYTGIQSGFTGLTPGASYFVSNTEGTLSTSAGATSIFVGKAISATQLLICQSNP